MESQPRHGAARPPPSQILLSTLSLCPRRHKYCNGVPEEACRLARVPPIYTCSEHNTEVMVLCKNAANLCDVGHLINRILKRANSLLLLKAWKDSSKGVTGVGQDSKLVSREGSGQRRVPGLCQQDHTRVCLPHPRALSGLFRTLPT